MAHRAGPGAPALVDRLGIKQAIGQYVTLAYADKGKSITDPVFAMVERLVRIIEDEQTNDVLRVRCVEMLLHYMCGKPNQSIDFGDNSLTVVVTKATE